MIPDNYVNLCFNNQVRCNYNFTENFLRITFPTAWDLSEDEDEISEVTLRVKELVGKQIKEQVREQVKDQVIKWLDVLENEMSVLERMKGLKLNEEAIGLAKMISKNYKNLALLEI